MQPVYTLGRARVWSAKNTHVVACGQVPVKPSSREDEAPWEKISPWPSWLTASGPLLKNQCPFVCPAHLAACQLGWSHLMKPDPVTWFLIHWVKVTLQLKSSTHHELGAQAQHGCCSMLLSLQLLFWIQCLVVRAGLSLSWISCFIIFFSKLIE